MENNKNLFTEEERKILKTRSAYMLPDRPSSNGFSASQIKRSMYEPILYMFDLLKKYEDNNALYYKNLNEKVDKIINGETIVEQAKKDSLGNVIHETYAKKGETSGGSTPDSPGGSTPDSPGGSTPELPPPEYVGSTEVSVEGSAIILEQIEIPAYPDVNKPVEINELDNYTEAGNYDLILETPVTPQVRTFSLRATLEPTIVQKRAISLHVGEVDDSLMQYYEYKEEESSGYLFRSVPKEIGSFAGIEWKYVSEPKFNDFILNEDITLNVRDKIKGIINYVIRNKNYNDKPFFINRTYYITQQHIFNNNVMVTVFNMTNGTIYHGIGNGQGYSVDTLPENIDDIIYKTNDTYATKEELEQQVENLQAQLNNIPVFEKEVASNSYITEVPNKALDYSLVEEIGGMSYEENGVFYHTKVTSVNFEQKNLIPLKEGTKSSAAYTAVIDKDGWITLNKTKGNGDMWFTIANQGDFYLPKDKTYSARVRYYDEKIPNIGSIVFLYEGVTDTPTTRFMTLGYKDGSGYPSTQMYAAKNVGKIYIYGNNNNLEIVNAKFKVELVENDFINDSIEIPNEVQALEGYGMGRDSENYNFIKYHEEDNKYYFHRVVDNDLVIKETPEVIDISSYMNDEYLQVQENGVVKFVNEKQKAVPNKITYAIKVV